MAGAKFDWSAFYKSVYSIVAEVPPGFVITYGEIAILLGKPQYSRMVARALSGAPAELNLPCHRVVNSQGRTAPAWLEQKRLLKEEGVVFKENGLVDMGKCRWRWEEL